MKLLFYSPVHLMHGGGCERWHIDVLTRLRDQYGYQVKLITGDFGGHDIPKEEVIKRLRGIDYQIVKTKKVLGGLMRVPNKEARQVIEREVSQADVVHFIFGFFGQDLLMLKLKKKHGTKIIAGIHAPLFYENTWHNLYVATISRFYTMPSFDGFMALNPGEYQTLKKWKLPNACFIPSGVDVDKFIPKPDKRDKAKLTILFAGRFEMQKAPDLAAMAIRKFLQATAAKDVIFRFIGSGSMEQYLKDLVRDFPKQIDLVGYTTEPVPFFQETDLFFLPSRQEPFGLVIVEAMACGAPILASKTDGPLLMIKDGQTGWFFEKLSSVSIANKLQEVYQMWKKDPQVFKGWQQRLRQQALKYSIDASINKMNSKFFK